MQKKKKIPTVLLEVFSMQYSYAITLHRGDCRMYFSLDAHRKLRLWSYTIKKQNLSGVPSPAWCSHWCPEACFQVWDRGRWCSWHAGSQTPPQRRQCRTLWCCRQSCPCEKGSNHVGFLHTHHDIRTPGTKEFDNLTLLNWKHTFSLNVWHNILINSTMARSRSCINNGAVVSSIGLKLVEDFSLVSSKTNRVKKYSFGALLS